MSCPKLIVSPVADLDLEGELARLEQLRGQHLALLEGLDGAGWERTGRHGQHGVMSVEL